MGRLTILLVTSALSALAQLSWEGKWTLNLAKSTLAPILVPGSAEPLVITGQVLTIERIAGGMKLSGDTSLTGRDPIHEEQVVNQGFVQIDEATFEVRVSLGTRVGVNRFEFSADGKTLRETKVQTDNGVEISRSILVFER